MSNISNAFKNGKAFIGFVTAGDPDLDSSLEIMTVSYTHLTLPTTSRV